MIQEDGGGDLSVAAQLKSTLARIKESSGPETGEPFRPQLFPARMFWWTFPDYVRNRSAGVYIYG